ncbi:hypothetical protein G1K97_03365 [Tenacibaculum finnmarkense]|uniref:hypothetical protein n=1 Tax=Tenacibaculum finnmarkense TaxID=2781243 RepID=UPI001EFC240F|nr:hypothetical protein [Tenacibaculum finnmarkense]MCG8892746.1 hypothetical protein [Tenacibaculum finnmarkense]MCG8900882.1 hypothetical protein [Tenacibaculum finnmarkense]
MKTRKNKIAKILKAGLLCFSISLLLWSCENEEILNTKNKVKLTHISLKDLEEKEKLNIPLAKIVNKLDYQYEKKEGRGKTNTGNLTILTDDILETISGNSSTYTFRLQRKTDTSVLFENFVIYINSIGDYEFYILQFSENLNSNSTNPYEVAYIAINKDLNYFNFIEKSSEQASRVKAAVTLGDCMEISFDTCGSGGKTDGHNSIDGCGGSDTIYDFSNCNLGGGSYGAVSSGGSIKTIKDNLNNYNISGNNSFNTNNTGSNSSSSGISYVGVLNPPLLECGDGYERYFDKDAGPRGVSRCKRIAIEKFLGLSLQETNWLNKPENKLIKTNIEKFLDKNNSDADAVNFSKEAIKILIKGGEVDFENQIINNLTGKALCVYGKLKDNSLLKKTLEKFKGKTPVNLILNQKSNLREDDENSNSPLVNGKTYYGASYNITIILNTEQSKNRPSLAVARTILHEAIHADIYRKIKTNGGLLSSNNTWLLNGSRVDFPSLFDAYNENPKNPYHNYMAKYYREALEFGLKEYATSIGETHSNQFYEDMAWNGLLDTKAWKQQYINNTYANKEKVRIKKIIANFRNSGNNECK